MNNDISLRQYEDGTLGLLVGDSLQYPIRFRVPDDFYISQGEHGELFLWDSPSPSQATVKISLKVFDLSDRDSNVFKAVCADYTTFNNFCKRHKFSCVKQLRWDTNPFTLQDWVSQFYAVCFGDKREFHMEVSVLCDMDNKTDAVGKLYKVLEQVSIKDLKESIYVPGFSSAAYLTMTGHQWTPQDLIDDLQRMIDEHGDAGYMDADRWTLETARDYLREFFFGEH